MARVLYLDIETLPNLARVWGTYKQRTLEILEYPVVCAYAARWDGGKRVVRALPDTKRSHPRDDRALVQELWDLLDEADIVIAHYGDGFDLPFLRARFAFHKMAPPTPWKSVDTKRTAARLFHFGGSYKLDHICGYLGIGKKMPTGGYELWQGCMDEDPKAWAKMKKYNAHDIVLLEGLYKVLRPWMPDHPSVFAGAEACPKCGSAKLQSRGVSRSQTREYRRFQCQKCGGWGRYTKSSGKVLVTNVG